MTVREWFRLQRAACMAPPAIGAPGWLTDRRYGMDIWTLAERVVNREPLEPILQLGAYRLICGGDALREYTQTNDRLHAIHDLMQQALADLDEDLRRRRALERFARSIYD